MLCIAGGGGHVSPMLDQIQGEISALVTVK